MPSWIAGRSWLVLVLLLLASQATFAADVDTLAGRTERLLQTLQSSDLRLDDAPDERTLPAVNLRIRHCDSYPYHEDQPPRDGARQLLADLRAGMQTGLQCLGGNGPMGRLHPYHEYQAHRLLTLLESPQDKTFQCVEDAMFATAVATDPQGTSIEDPLYQQLREVDYPAVIFDTYRLGGILSRRHDDQTYRTFFHLAEDQIVEHRSGQPLRPASLHRYRDRAGLVFHELTHWLGHRHSALYPDVATLYETCCFGGSDYISDPDTNAAHQQTACNILKDDALWSQSYRPYTQMRLWHHKGYDRFKLRLRADFDS